jgi:DNA mismatch endonuclease (patch repair protein)
VLPKYRSIVFVHGCFWHRHPKCRFAYLPKSRHAFWESKFIATRDRDRKVIRQLRRLGWRVIVIWECELREPRRVAITLDNQLRQYR